MTRYPAAVDVQTISNVLSGVENWEGLARWLDLERGPIQAKCLPKLNGAKHECYRRTLVQQYCEKCGSREEVVEKIAQVLEEKMNNKLKAQQLRKLSCGERRIQRKLVSSILRLTTSGIIISTWRAPRVTVVL